MTEYRQNHLDPAQFGSEEPSAERALLLFGQMEVIRQRPPSLKLQLFFESYPALEQFIHIENDLQRARQQRQRERSEWTGLLPYLAGLLSWDISVTFLEQKEIDEIRGKRHAPTYSSKEIGVQVDSDIQETGRGKSLFGGPHPYALWFMQYCYQRSWMFCGAQVPLALGSVRTAADVICFDLINQRFVLIELKTGYDNDYELPIRPRLAGEITEDSHYWRHQYQLGWMMACAKPVFLKYGLAIDGCVLRISAHSGVRAPHILAPIIEKYFGGAYNEQMHMRYLEPDGNSVDAIALRASQQ